MQGNLGYEVWWLALVDQKRWWRRRRAAVAAVGALALFYFAACSGGGGSSPVSPPTPAASEWFFVENFSGDVSGFTASSGKLAAIPGSSAQFPIAMTQFAVEPGGSFLAATTVSPQMVSTLQIANIASGDAISLQPLTTTVTDPGGLAISSKGVIAVTDSTDSTMQLLMVQNGLLFSGGTVATGAFPQDLVFSTDGNALYVGNDGDGTISLFSVANGATPQLLQTAKLFGNPGGPGVAIVRVRLNPSGSKFAATTLDGVLYVADVNATDHSLSNIQQIQVANNANLEEVIFDPTGENLYTADQDNGGIYGFALAGESVTSLPGSPFPTPVFPTGMTTDSAGTHLYVVIGPASQILTFNRDPSNGKLTATGDSVSTGGAVGGRIMRVPAH
jgi:DNA-binding beta-propeller fold protein YncE